MANKEEIAVQKFSEGFNCAQSVLYAYAQDLDLDPDTALKLACGFGGGMARKGEVCGALTGGIIALGAKYGRGEQDGSAATEATYARVRTLMEQFAAQHGSTICRQLLLGADLSTEAGRQFVRENDLSKKVCQNCVKSVAHLLQELL